MPLVDMPLEQLREYQGITPCPPDIDKYWDRAIEEMTEVYADTQLMSARFKCPYADCYHMYFTGVKGARIHAKLLKPKIIKSPVPAVLLFHGYTGSCGDWINMLPYVAAGFVVAALDCRGQGGQSEDVGGVKGNTHMGHIIRGLDGNVNDMLMRNIFLDTAQLAKIIMEMDYVDETRVGALGGSQGGGLTLACASLEPRINRLAPVYPFLSDYKRIWEMDLAKNAYEEIRRYFRSFDPLHRYEDRIFEKLGYIDIQNLTKRIKGKVIMAVGLMDEICPPSTQYAAFNKITSEKQDVIYPDFGHEHLPEFTDVTFQFMMEMLG